MPFGEDQPWAVRFDNLYARILYDDCLFKCWYTPFTIDLATAETPIPLRRPCRYIARLQDVYARYGAVARKMASVMPLRLMALLGQSRH